VCRENAYAQGDQRVHDFGSTNRGVPATRRDADGGGPERAAPSRKRSVRTPGLMSWGQPNKSSNRVPSSAGCEAADEAEGECDAGEAGELTEGAPPPPSPMDSGSSSARDESHAGRGRIPKGDAAESAALGSAREQSHTFRGRVPKREAARSDALGVPVAQISGAQEVTNGRFDRAMSAARRTSPEKLRSAKA
jgi:hypothetical protein